MMDEQKENDIILKNAKYSLIIKIIDYFLAFIKGPLLLACLGNTKYGIYASTLSIISWMYYFDFGIGSGMRNKVTECVTNKDMEAAQSNISTAYVLVSLISAVLVSLVLVFIKFVDSEVLLNAYIPDEDLNLIIAIAFVLAGLNFIFSLSSNILYAIQEVALVNALGILANVITLIMLLIFRGRGIHLILCIVVVDGVSQLIKNLVALYYIQSKDRKLTFDKRYVDFSYSEGILGFGIQIFIMQLSALVLNSTDNILIMKFFAPSEVTPYSFSYKYFSIINAFFVAATGPLWTAYTTAYTQKNVTYIKKTLKRALMFYSLVLVGILFALFIFKPFMKFYLQQELYYQPGLPELMALYFAILIFSHNFSAFVHGISKVKYTTIACLISTVVNIPLSIIFAVNCLMRINGILLGSIVCLIITTITYVWTTIKEIQKMAIDC